MHMAWQDSIVYGLAGLYCIWPGGTLLCMAWRDSIVYGLAGSPVHMAWLGRSAYGLLDGYLYGQPGPYCIWPGGSSVYMAWRVFSVYGLAGLRCI